MAAAANVKISARRSISTPLGYGPATATYGLITGSAPDCQYLHPESSANGAARQASGALCRRGRGLWARFRTGAGSLCPLRFEGRSRRRANG